MKFVLRLVLNLALRLALIAVLATLILGLPAQAEDLGAGEIQVSTQLVCNTQHEAFRFARLYSGDAEAALRIVNAEESDQTACAIIPVIYSVGSRLGSARTKTGSTTFNIVKILVIGVVTTGGVRTVLPTEYFSALAVDERDA
jgi:uncharacterized membrane protein YraQ (UPF0718 family)